MVLKFLELHKSPAKDDGQMAKEKKNKRKSDQSSDNKRGFLEYYENRYKKQ